MRQGDGLRLEIIQQEPLLQSEPARYLRSIERPVGVGEADMAGIHRTGRAYDDGTRLGPGRFRRGDESALEAMMGGCRIFQDDFRGHSRRAADRDAEIGAADITDHDRIGKPHIHRRAKGFANQQSPKDRAGRSACLSWLERNRNEWIELNPQDC